MYQKNGNTGRGGLFSRTHATLLVTAQILFKDWGILNFCRVKYTALHPPPPDHSLPPYPQFFPPPSYHWASRHRKRFLAVPDDLWIIVRGEGGPENARLAARAREGSRRAGKWKKKIRKKNINHRRHSIYACRPTRIFRHLNRTEMRRFRWKLASVCSRARRRRRQNRR